MAQYEVHLNPGPMRATVPMVSVAVDQLGSCVVPWLNKVS
jgi:hypothetical protein